MKLKKTVMALLLTGTMIMGMGTSVFAEGTTTVGTGSVSITKNLELAEGIAIPTESFAFTAESTTPGAATATITNISYASADAKGTLTDGKYIISKESAITFGTFPHAGMYEYTVKETKGSNSNVAYSSDEYTLRVYVENDDNPTGGLKIAEITAEKGGVKQEKVLFTNTYTKTGNLTISKNVAGKHADKTKDFEFKITFTKAATAGADDNTFTGKIGENKVVTCTKDVEQTFNLHHGETLTFTDIPAGTRYVVTEVGAEDGYTPKVKVVENGTTTVNDIEATDEKADYKAVASGSETALVGEGTNSVTFTNTFADIAITGVIVNNLPFILLIALGVCALGLLAVAKRRRMSDR